MHLISATSHRITHMTVQSFGPTHIVLYWTQEPPLFLQISVLIVEKVCKITNCILAIEIFLKIPGTVCLTQNAPPGLYLNNVKDPRKPGLWKRIEDTGIFNLGKNLTKQTSNSLKLQEKLEKGEEIDHSPVLL